MRWFVEVSSLGKTDLHQFCVEAESWQRALQAARVQRGEDGPMSGFSIELLEEGYRAIDPVARVRFVVRRAPDDAPISAPLVKDAKAGIAPSRLSTAPAAATTSSSPPSMKSTPPRPVDKSVSAPVTPRSSEPQQAAAPAVATAASALPAVGSSLPGLPPVKVLSAREQDPTESSPLTYREYSFVVPAGTNEEVAAEVLRGQLKLVDAHLAEAKKGKLVNLAAFDVEYRGKPPPPIATLTWKDWKGAPVVGFPRRGSATKQVKPPSSPPPPMQASQAPVGVFPEPSTVSQPPPQPTFVSSPPQSPFSMNPSSIPPPSFLAQSTAPVAPPPVQLGSVPPPPPPPTQVGSIPPPPPPPTQVGSVPPPPPPAMAAPSQPPPSMPVPVPAPAFFEAPAPAPSSARQGSSPDGTIRTPSGRYIRGRTTGDELITQLFESMHDLHFLRDALDGGQFCLALATEVLPARAALIHFFDLEKREWVVACARGKDTSRLLTLRTPESDELLREAARKRRAIVNPKAEATAQRYQSIGSVQSVIIAPIMQAGRALGALELINPLDGMPFTDGEGNAMTYIAEQYAEYLGSRGIVLDQQRIQAATH